MAKRIQRQRTKGWRMPEGAVYVGRPTKWGNPFRIEDSDEPTADPRANAILAFECSVTQRHAEIKSELHGKDLACWCPIGQPCHADVLLKIANEGTGS